MTIDNVLKALSSDETHEIFSCLYGTEQKIINEQKKRYSDLIEIFRNRFGDMDVQVFSSPGRTEIGGNHTDHNHGKVLAASVQLDCIAVVAYAADGLVHICDSKYNEDFIIDTGDISPPNSEKGAYALIRGIIEGFKKEKLKIGGFYACITSDVIPASGVSSSASFEMLICQTINELYNEAAISISKLSCIGQYAENVWWGKASGLLDQMACGVGGFVSIDFINPDDPLVEKIPFDFSNQGYSLILVNTGGNHAELSSEYSSIPSEMKQVAGFFSKNTLRDVSIEDIIKNLSELRTRCSDRAVMRAFHFLEENLRVSKEIKALKENDFYKFLSHINDSGNSSWKWLQNVYVPSDSIQKQSVSISLALTEIFISQRGLIGKAACRIHGGGFAGVIQVFLPHEQVDAYKKWMIEALHVKDNPVFVMSIRPYGVIKVI